MDRSVKENPRRCQIWSKEVFKRREPIEETAKKLTWRMRGSRQGPIRGWGK